MKWLARLFGWGNSDRKHYRKSKKSSYHAGALPDEADERDYAYAISATPQEIQSFSSVESLASPVRYQGSAGSCVAHAAALCYEIEMRKAGVEFDASELQLYYDGRIRAGLFPQDQGMYPRECLKVLLKDGVAPEKLWPYDLQELNIEPGLWARSFQKFFKIASFHALDFVSAKKEIDDGHAIMLNIPIYNSFYNCTGEYLEPQPDENVLGYHEVAILAHDENKQNSDGSLGAFLIQNSWGTSWGKQGRAWLSYNLFTKRLPGNPQLSQYYSIRMM